MIKVKGLLLSRLLH